MHLHFLVQHMYNTTTHQFLGLIIAKMHHMYLFKKYTLTVFSLLYTGSLLIFFLLIAQLLILLKTQKKV